MSNWLNSNTSKQIPFRVTVGCLLLLILTPIIIPTILTTQVEAASAPSYKYYNSGNDIGAIGGQFGNNTVKLSQTTTGSNTYTGSTQVTVTYNESFWSWVPFLNIGGQTVTCTAGMQINVNSNDRATGSISTPADLNIPDNTITSHDAASVLGPCSAKQASHISDFNQSNISIGGSTSDTTQLGDQSESVVTSQISVGVDSNVPYDKLPSGIKITLSPTTLGNTGTQESSNDLIFSSDPVATQTTFTSVDPGIYKICITPSSIFNFDQCQTVTKTRGTLLIVAFGSPDTVSFSLGKTVKVTVNIKIPSGIKTGTFGPIPIELSNSSGVIKVTNTDVYNLDSAHIPADEQLNLLTSPNFDSIEPSTKPNDYKVCIQNTTLCTTFTKEVNTQSNVTITVPADQSSQFFTLLNTTSCSVEGIGWIVCPTLTFLGKISDVAFNFLASSFLSTNTSLLNTDPNNGTIATYDAWQIMRNIANVAFVIAFLIIIFSQITSIGITNYGIKKMFPKLIIAAIMVNLSFFVCQIAVDLSNIAGYSFKGLFSSLSQLMQTPDVFSPGNATGNGFGIAALIVAGLAGGVTLLFAMSFPVLISVFLALIMIVLILVARTALIVILVIISPLAFVAYLLPNTEQYFKKWGKMFANLLLVFPIISVLFGAGSLAGYVIKASAGEDKVMQLVAIGVAIVPLFMVPSLLKNSMSAAGSIGTKLAGLSTKANGRIGSKVKDTSRLGQIAEYRRSENARNRALTQSGAYVGRNPISKGLSSINKSIYQSGYTGKFGSRALTRGVTLGDAEDAELTKNAGSRLDNMILEGKPLSQSQMLQIATKQDVTDDGTATGRKLADKSMFDTYARRSAIQKSAKIATVKEAHELIDAVGVNGEVGERKALIATLPGTSALGSAPYLGGLTLANITQGYTPATTGPTAGLGLSVSEAGAYDYLTKGKMNAEKLAGADPDSVTKMINTTLKLPVGSPERIAARNNLMAAYNQYSSPDSVRLRERVGAGGNLDNAIQDIALRL